MLSFWRNTISLIVSLALATSLCLAVTGHKVWSAQQPVTVFVDLDGDGFDDRAGDRNRDGIPDMTEQTGGHSISGAAGLADATGDIFAGKFDSPSGLEDILDNSERFVLLKQSCRALTGYRGRFDGDFGPGEGIGVGAVKGVAAPCSGGVCPL